ncbi:MAG: non-canonical purine NTP pyrophosphatase [Vampirovibrionales bacterium]
MAQRSTQAMQGIMCFLATHNPHKLKEVETLLRVTQAPSVHQQGKPACQLNVLPGYVSPEETGMSFQENARLKAMAGVAQLGVCYETSVSFQQALSGYAWSQVYIVAEDAGMCIEAPPPVGYEGPLPWPGVWSNRWVTPQLWHTLLSEPFPSHMTSETLCLALRAWQAKYHPYTPLRAYYQSTLAVYRMAECVSSEGVLPIHQIGTPTFYEATLPLTLLPADEALRGKEGFGYDPMTLPLGKSRTCAELHPEEKATISHRAKAWQQWLKTL